jgi:MFS superfamily sulfate permease-like transporter
MSDARYNFDNGGRKFTLKINPKEAVIIESKDSYYIDRDGEKAIDLIDLRIKDNGKEIYFENSKRLLEEFKKNDFEITYK